MIPNPIPNQSFIRFRWSTHFKYEWKWIAYSSCHFLSQLVSLQLFLLFQQAVHSLFSENCLLVHSLAPSLFPSLLRSPCYWLILFTFPLFLSLSIHRVFSVVVPPLLPHPVYFFPSLPAGTVLVKNGWCGRICEYGRHIRGGRTAIQDSAQELLAPLVTTGEKAGWVGLWGGGGWRRPCA